MWIWMDWQSYLFTSTSSKIFSWYRHKKYVKWTPKYNSMWISMISNAINRKATMCYHFFVQKPSFYVPFKTFNKVRLNLLSKILLKVPFNSLGNIEKQVARLNLFTTKLHLLHFIQFLSIFSTLGAGSSFSSYSRWPSLWEYVLK